MALVSIGKGTKLHELKCHSVYYRATERGEMTAQVRINDRDYKVGDIVLLTEIKEAQKKSGPIEFVEGEKLCVRIMHALSGGQFGIAPDHVVLSVRPIYLSEKEIDALRTRKV